jgi:hypothetical protein
MDIVEVVEVRGWAHQGAPLKAHRVYRGWLGVGMLLSGEHGR